MLKQLFINSLLRISGLLIIFFLLIPVCVYSRETVKKNKYPIVVTSKMLTIDSKNSRAIFENSVVAETQDMTIYADRMFIFYNKDTGNVTRVDALGKVKVVEKNRVITSDEATYYAQDEKIIFRGDLKVIEGEYIDSGKMARNISDGDRESIDNNKILIKKIAGNIWFHYAPTRNYRAF